MDLKGALLHVARRKNGIPSTQPLTGRELRTLRALPRVCLGCHLTPFGLACGFTLANKGTDTRTIQAYLGHRNIQHTVRYTELAPGRFKGLFSD